MKKICFFFESYYVGGLDTFVTQLINNWPKDGYSIILLCNKSHSGASLFQQNIKHPNAQVELYDMCLSKDWANAICKNKHSFLYRLISVFTYICLIPYYILWGYCRLRLSRFDSLMSINGGYPAALSCRCIPISWKLHTKRKSIMNFHNHAILPNILLRPFETFIDKKMIKSVSHIVSVSRICADSIRIRKPFKDLNNIEFIYNGVDRQIVSPSFDIRKKFALSDETHILMMLATYEARKGHGFILSVFERVVKSIPDCHLFFCGYGTQEEREVVKSLARDKRISEHVSVLDFKPNAMEYLAQTDLLLIGSQKFESFGLTAIEGMKYKKPVLSTNIGGLKEVIRDGYGGYLFDCDNVEGMAAKAIELLQSPALMKEQGNKGYDCFRTNFTIERMVAAYVEYFK